MANQSEILSWDKNHLSLLYDRDITVDKELPKYTRIKEEVEKFKKISAEDEAEDDDTHMSLDMSLKSDALEKSFKKQNAIKELLRKYEQIRDGNVRQVNIFINKYMFNDIY